MTNVLRLCTGRTAHRGSRGIALLRLCTGRTAHRGSRGIALLRLCTGRTAHTGSRGIALLFRDYCTRRGWGVSVTPWPLFTPGKDPAPIVQETGWAPTPVWTDVENLAPTPEFDPQTVQPVASRYTDWANQATCLREYSQINFVVCVQIAALHKEQYFFYLSLLSWTLYICFTVNSDLLSLGNSDRISVYTDKILYVCRYIFSRISYAARSLIKFITQIFSLWYLNQFK